MSTGTLQQTAKRLFGRGWSKTAIGLVAGILLPTLMGAGCNIADLQGLLNGLGTPTDTGQSAQNVPSSIDTTLLTLGLPGATGENGLSCWDTNGDGIAEPEEDINGDGQFNALDCVGPAGQAGDNGSDGENGQNGQNGANGATGATGAAGAQGPAGLACWDLNGDGLGDLETEDTNHDGNLDALDCQGAQGPQGEPGQDVAPPYGNGSAGAREPETDQPGSTLTGLNLQFTDFTVGEGETLYIKSGAVIRCTGKFVNYGTIVVMTGALGPARVPNFVTPPANPGASLLAAGNGDPGGANGVLQAFGGAGGIGLDEISAGYTVHPGVNAGGSGGCGSASGSAGGGSLVVLAKGGIENYGTMHADGGTGDGGGGAGGIMILASPQYVNCQGVLTAVGGNGVDQPVGGPQAAGGGGGGGIIQVLAPEITMGGGEGDSALDVSGGYAGKSSGKLASGLIYGGGGGGACGGNGGAGSSVQRTPQSDSVTPATDGGTGWILQTVMDPSSLF